MSWDELVKNPDAAGVAGAILGWLSAPGGTLRMQLFNICAGLACAVFLAPYVAERAGIESKSGLMAFSFVVGLVGMNLLPKITSAAQRGEWRDLLPWNWKKGNP